MHDPEKSDSGIVAMKPTNKAGRPVAEPVEPRPGTKGNAEQQSTLRTQGRERSDGGYSPKASRASFAVRGIGVGCRPLRCGVSADKRNAPHSARQLGSSSGTCKAEG